MRRFLLLAAAPLLAALLLAGPAGAAAPPPAADFFGNTSFSNPALSPDGRHLAVRMSAEGRRDWLAVVDLNDFSSRPVAQFRDGDIGQFQWVNNQRLLYNATDKSLGARDRQYAPGLYVVEYDGSHPRQLADRNQLFLRDSRQISTLLPWHTYMMEAPGAQNSNVVYVYDAGFSEAGVLRYLDLLRLDTATGRTEPVEHPGHSQQWLLDQNGEPRLISTEEGPRYSLRYRDPASGAWHALATENLYLAGRDTIEPVGFGPDGALYVASNHGKDKSSLYRYDLASGKLAEQPLVSLDGFDFDGQLVVSDTRLLGVRVRADARTTVWLDEAMKQAQAAIDARLPATVNLVTPPRRPQSPALLVTAYSDRQPEKYLIYNTETKRLTEVGNHAARIQPRQMGSRELVYYKARDGLEIPAWLTLPPGVEQPGKLPLVVLVHGGPFVRGGDWRWEPESQFLATRGYAVLEPEYRGSTGYGVAHFMAGIKQWGLKMQDDIADGARWAIARGTADPRRICIAGASYGGYATLMGLLRDPGLYRCGIEWAGPTDIQLMYEGSWFYSSDLPASWAKYGMPQLIGDPEQDAAQLKATSPLQLAAGLKQPLLMAYGGADKRVPLNHGLKFRDALRPANPNLEWIEYGEEGHGWALPHNRIDFWTRVEKFLAKYNGPQP